MIHVSYGSWSEGAPSTSIRFFPSQGGCVDEVAMVQRKQRFDRSGGFSSFCCSSMAFAKTSVSGTAQPKASFLLLRS